jgi:hypothetical protein
MSEYETSGDSQVKIRGSPLYPRELKFDDSKVGGASTAAGKKRNAGAAKQQQQPAASQALAKRLAKVSSIMSHFSSENIYEYMCIMNEYVCVCKLVCLNLSKENGICLVYWLREPLVRAHVLRV